MSGLDPHFQNFNQWKSICALALLNRITQKMVTGWLVHSADFYWALAICQVLLTPETAMTPGDDPCPHRVHYPARPCLLSAFSFSSVMFLPSSQHWFPALSDCHILFSVIHVRGTCWCLSMRFSSGYSLSCDVLSGPYNRDPKNYSQEDIP